MKNKPQPVEVKNKQGDPDYIITKEGKTYRFQCWYWMQLGERSWVAASAVDKDGQTFAVAESNIKTKVYNAQ